MSGVIDLRTPTPEPISLPPSPDRPSPAVAASSRDSSFRPSPSRRSTTGPSPPLRPVAGPSGLRAAEAIDLSLEDDDDDVPLPPPRPRVARPPAPQRLDNERFRHEMDPDRAVTAELDLALSRAARARAHVQRLAAVEAQTAAAAAAVALAANHAPADRPAGSIGLGGAVLRRGNREVRFDPIGATRQFHLQPGNGLAAAPEPPAGAMPTRRVLRRRLVDPDYEPDEGDGVPLGAAGAAQRGFFGRLAALGQMANAGLFQYPLIPDGIMGRAPRENDVAAILAKVSADTVPEARKGFSRTWEAEDIDADPADKAIRIDDAGRVIPPTPKKKRKPYLSCAHCVNALRVSSAHRDAKDNVWALRCGHLIDQRCLHDLCAQGGEGEGEGEDGADDARPAKRARASPRKSKRRTAAKPPVEQSWTCPVADCKRAHVAVLVDGQWTQKQGEGAIQIYV
ncbi:hypothetical protein Q8F55_007449 [Vanrija albida]|uniref:RING-type domain-containing protein n=1 Tax=Vanrija albida TaxID=181172 RepID=A0ABR3PTK8_9TREE